MYTFGLCSLWHLAAVSVVKCTVIVRPLTHITIFTDRILRAIICTIWTMNLLVSGAINVGVTDARFNWNTAVSVNLQNTVFARAFAAVNIVIATLIIMAAYTKMFLVVRRQVRSMPPCVLGSFGSSPIFGSSVRSAKNLFVMCAAYYLAYLPATLKVFHITRGLLTDTLNFAITWIYISSAAINGFLYIALHSSVRSELRRYLPRCGHSSVAPALRQPVGDGTGSQRYLASTNTGDTGTRDPLHAPVTVMTSSRQRATGRLSTAFV